MTGSELRRAPIGKLRWRRETMTMINQRIAESDPQLRIAGVAADCVLENSDGVDAIAMARKSLG